jgi:hypothetical protein
MSEVRGLRANKALRQSMRDMGLDDVIESADREDLEEAMKENKRLSKLNVQLAQPRRSGGGMMASEFTAAELATKIADLVFPHTSDQMQRRELEFLLTEFADAIRNERTEA